MILSIQCWVLSIAGPMITVVKNQPPSVIASISPSLAIPALLPLALMVYWLARAVHEMVSAWR